MEALDRRGPSVSAVTGCSTAEGEDIKVWKVAYPIRRNALRKATDCGRFVAKTGWREAPTRFYVTLMQ